MRIVRAPLRITLGGGGSDLPGFYEKHGGFLISAAIDKYITMTGSWRQFDKKYWLSYSRLEVCDSLEEIKHELLRKSLEKFSFETGVELHSISEISGNSGMGSSGSFLVCTLTLLNSLQKREMTRSDVAELAARIEMKDLGRSCGKQDHYIASHGGIICLDIDTRGRVRVSDLGLDPHVVKRLETNLLIYHTGFAREAESVLKQQTQNLRRGSKGVVSRMSAIKEIGLESKKRLLAGDLDGFGRLLHDHWRIKKEMQSDMTNPRIDEIYAAARKAGMLGGKIMGAGGGGFFMFYVPPGRQIPFRARMRKLGLAELDWKFDFSGCEVVFSN